MFTGIIEEKGIVKSVLKGSKSARLTVTARRVMKNIRMGDSINTNGVCLTVTDFTADTFTVDVMPETIRKTNLGQLSTGDPVNLERALLLSDRLGGHLVSGHIDGIGTVKRIWEEENSTWLSIQAGPSILRYVVERGSVALDGVSLTVVKVDAFTFEVSIITHTQQITTLTMKRTGDPVNIECDIIAKYAEKLLKPGNQESKITLEFLARNDFL
jgi:riboflavin synthase